MTFHSRITPSQAETCWQAVRQAGLVNHATKSVLLHDMEKMRARLETLKMVFPETTLHALAIKANPLVEVLRVAVDCGAGLEAASIEEVYLALAAGCPPDKVVFDSPAKTEEEIDDALRRGVHLNVDNFAELSRIADCLSHRETTSSVGLRVNPEVGSGTISQTSVAGVGSKFGVSISVDRKQILDAFSRFPWLVGLHTHVGSQGCGLDLLCEAVIKLDELRSEMQRELGRSIPMVNIGGGLPAAYTASCDPPTPRQYVQRLSRETPRLMQPDAQLVTEFGRCVQAGCGIAFSRVEYVRRSSSRTQEHYMAVIHLGADFLLRPVYRSSDWKHEFILLDKQGQVKRGEDHVVTIAGPLCFAGDIIAREVSLPRPEAGDWIAIRDCGAYTLSMWSRHCSRGIPLVIGYEGKDRPVRILREAETPEDIVAYWDREPAAQNVVERI